MALRPDTLRTISRIFQQLDYRSVGDIGCGEGGDAFWEERRGPAEQLVIKIADVLRVKLPSSGRSLYAGAGVAEIPALVMEALELEREVVPYNLRARESTVLNDACANLPFAFRPQDARTASGVFDHLWIVSVLNDPECFPELGALSSGRANPVTFDPDSFTVERQAVLALAADCLEKIARPTLVTTSVEEIPWITDWCERHDVACVVEDADYPTAIVQDPICFIRLGE